MKSDTLKNHEEFTQKISSFMDGMSPTRGASVFEKNDLCPPEDLFVKNSWNTYTKQNRIPSMKGIFLHQNWEKK